MWRKLPSLPSSAFLIQVESLKLIERLTVQNQDAILERMGLNYVGWVIFRNRKTIHSLRTVHPKAHLNAWHDMMTYQCIKEPSNPIQWGTISRASKLSNPTCAKICIITWERLNNSSQVPIWVSTNSEGGAKECVRLALIIRGRSPHRLAANYIVQLSYI